MSWLAGVVVIMILCSGTLAVASGDRPYRVEFDREAERTTVHVSGQGGELAWRDVVAGLFAARGFDGRAVKEFMPAGSVNLDSRTGRLALVAADVALGGGIDLEPVFDAKTGRFAALRIHLDRAQMLATERRFKRRLRDGLSAMIKPFAGAQPVPSGLSIKIDELDDDAERPVVIMIHGIHSHPQRLSAATAAIRSAGFTCGTFSYPNDQPIQSSARLLSRELKLLAERRPKCPIALVTFSMGGLVARAVLEDQDLDPGNVDRLVMIAPPNRGSRLADFAFALEVWEFVGAGARRELMHRAYEAIEDGLGEASDDLKPDSPFLRRLNRRSRHPDVAYSILLGTAGPLEQGALTELRERFRRAGESNRFVRFFGPKLDQLLGDLDEVVAGKGDGAVAVRRGRLADVDDVLLLPFSHVTALGRNETRVETQLRRAIIQRLGARPASP